MEGGWFQMGELSTPHTPFVTEIELNIDGRSVKVRRVYSPPDDVRESALFGDLDKKSAAWAAEALSQAEDSLVNEIRTSGALTP
jgi:hypothetical protein